MTTATPVVREDGKLVRRFSESSTRILEYIASAGIFVTMLHVLGNVISRTLWGTPLPGTNEYVAFLWLPAVAMVGFVVSVVRGQTIEADIFYDKFPMRIKREVRFVTSLITAVTFCGFAWYGFEEAIHALEIGKNATASHVYIAPIYALPPTVFFVLTVLFARDATLAILGQFDNESASVKLEAEDVAP